MSALFKQQVVLTSPIRCPSSRWLTNYHAPSFMYTQTITHLRTLQSVPLKPKSQSSILSSLPLLKLYSRHSHTLSTSSQPSLLPRWTHSKQTHRLSLFTKSPLFSSQSLSPKLPLSSSWYHSHSSSSSILLSPPPNASTPVTSLSSPSPSPPPPSTVSATGSEYAALRFALLGNLSICVLKLWSFLSTGSSAMFAEFIHTTVDTINQSLLYFGAVISEKKPDEKHQMGYGRASFFWSLLSALNVYWIGCSFTLYHSLFLPLGKWINQSFTNWSLDSSSTAITQAACEAAIAAAHTDTAIYSFQLQHWGVLVLSALVDAAVLRKTISVVESSRPAAVSFWSHLRNYKHPLILATLLEDVGALAGVGIASVGILCTKVFANPIFDEMASICVGGLLGYIAFFLIRLNYKFLLGYSVAPQTEDHIIQLILARESITNIYGVRAEWLSPSTFAFRAEIDLNGAYFAQKLIEKYKPLFKEAMSTSHQPVSSDSPSLTSTADVASSPSSSPSDDQRPSSSDPTDEQLSRVLFLFADEITTCVEEEVRNIEQLIRSYYPNATVIELEPASREEGGEREQFQQKMATQMSALTVPATNQELTSDISVPQLQGSSEQKAFSQKLGEANESSSNKCVDMTRLVSQCQLGSKKFKLRILQSNSTSSLTGNTANHK